MSSFNSERLHPASCAEFLKTSLLAHMRLSFDGSTIFFAAKPELHEDTLVNFIPAVTS